MHCPVLLSRRSGFALTTHSSFQGGSGNLPFGIHVPLVAIQTAPWNQVRPRPAFKVTEAPIDIDTFGHPLNETWQHLPPEWWVQSVIDALAWLPLPEEDRQRVVEAAHKIARDAATPATPAGFALQAPPHKEADDEIEQARKKMRGFSEPPRAAPWRAEDRLHKSTHLNTSPNNGNRFGA